MDERSKVYLVLIFPDSAEGRWVSKRPRIGSEIKNRLGVKWMVEEVLQSGIDTYTVHCGLPPSLGLTHAQDLVADLLDRAREALSPGWRRREYFPDDPVRRRRQLNRLV
jgi:hypothetical protein